MKKYYELIFYYIKKQWKFTISIALAIIIAAGLMVCTLTLNKSRIRNIIDTDKYEIGKFYGAFYGLSEKDLVRLKGNNKIKETAVIALLGLGKLKNGHGLEIEGFDENSIKMFDYTLAKGHFPKHYGEIAIEKWMLDNLRLKPILGQKLTFNYENKFKDKKFRLHSYKGREQFKLVGILNDNHYSKTGNNCAITTLKTVKKLLPQNFFMYSGFVTLKNYKGIQGQIASVKKAIGDKEAEATINRALAEDYGNYNDNGSDILSFAALKDFVYNNLPIIIAVFMIIYNIFNMSVAKRLKDYGILRAIGTKPNQIRRLIYGEALIITLFAIPIGILSGVAAAKLFVLSTNKVIDNNIDVGRKIFIPMNSCIIAMLIIFISVMFSIIIPAINAGKTSPMAILSGSGVYIKQSKLKVSRFYKLLINNLGINTVMAFQNIWRNKRRFFITVLCMCICGSLFLDKANWNSIYDNMEKAWEYQKPFVSSKAQYHIETTPENDNGIKTGYSAKDYKDIKSIKGVTQIEAVRRDFSSKIIADNKMFTNSYKAFCKKANWELSFDSPTIGYDTQNIMYYKKFLTSGSVNVNDMKNNNTVLLANAIFNNTAFKEVPITKYKALDKLRVNMRYKAADGKIKYKEVTLTIGGIVNGKSFLADLKGIMGLNIIMHENLFKRLTNTNAYQSFDVYSKNPSENRRLSYELKNIAMRIQDGYFQDDSKEQERSDSQQKQTDIIDQGILLSLIIIAVLNIFNTMAANIRERKRELGLLKIVGDTNRQIVAMITVEALIYGAASSIISFIAGNIITYSVYSKYHKVMTGMKLIISWQGTLILFITSIAISIIASLTTFWKSK